MASIPRTSPAQKLAHGVRKGLPQVGRGGPTLATRL